MTEDEPFIFIAGLLCEPTRARMLWVLLDGRAYTAGELASVADISVTSASNHLSKLLEADLLKVEPQGRHRYYSFATTEVAYAVEALANLASTQRTTKTSISQAPQGIRYCRTCYDHLAGFVGVRIAEVLEQRGYISKTGTTFMVTEIGWNWFAQFGIQEGDFAHSRRPLIRPCLDWSERRPHLAGQLGAVFLKKLFERNWFKKMQFSRELLITSKGRQEAYELLGIRLQ